MYISIGGFKLDPFGQLVKERAVFKYEQTAAPYHAPLFAEKATAGFGALADGQGLSQEVTDRWVSEHSLAPSP